MTQDTSARTDAADRYVVISSDCHAGASIPMYARVPRGEVPRRLRRVGSVVREPVPRPPRHRVTRLCAQLRQSGPPAPARERRHRRRGHLPQHHPAVLPERHPHAPGSDPGAVRAALGGDPRPQSLVGRLLQRAARSARRRRAAPAQRRRRRARRGPPGQGRGTLRRSDDPEHRARLASPAAARADLRAAVGAVRRVGAAGEHARRYRRAQPRSVPGHARADVPRVRLVRAAPAAASAVQRGVRAPPASSRSS